MSQDHTTIRQLRDEEWQSVEFGQQWDALLTSSTHPTIFSSWDWAVAWWHNFRGQTHSYVLAVYDKLGELIGIAPLYVAYEWALGTLPYKSLHIIGDHSAGSEYLGLITAAGLEHEVVESVMGYLSESQETKHLYHFSGLRDDSVAGRALIKLVENLKGRLCRHMEPCIYIALPSNYEEYLNKLSKKFRWNVLYQARRIRKDFEMRMMTTEREEQIDFHLERLFELHTGRWAKRKLPGTFRSENKQAFYRDVSYRFLKRGWLLFFHLEVNGVIRACNYGFRYCDTFYELQTGYDVEFEQQYKGIGVVLKAQAIEYCIKEGLTKYDFLGGSEDFKTRWGTERQITTTLEYYPPGAWAWLTYMGTDGVVRVKRHVKKLTVGEKWDWDVVRSRLLWSIRHPITKQPKQVLDGKKPEESISEKSETNLKGHDKA